MEFFNALLLALLYSSTVLGSVIPPSNSVVLNDINDGHVDVTTLNGTHSQDFLKRQNQAGLQSVLKALHGIGSKYASVKHDRFAEEVVAALWKNNSNYNYIACSAPHSYDFQGPRGVDWDHKKIDWTGKVGGLTPGITYDVVIGREGSFSRYGNGGFLNWAYIGNIKSRDDSGGITTVYFNAPNVS